MTSHSNMKKIKDSRKHKSYPKSSKVISRKQRRLVKFDNVKPMTRVSRAIKSKKLTPRLVIHLWVG